MELRVLKYFTTIVQEGNISNAANVLHISQSTLSRQIKDLEEELETILFVRGNRSISLTQDGQYLYSRASEILQIATDAESTIKSKETVTGSLHVGVGENYMAMLVSQVFAQIVNTYSGVQVHLHNLASDLIPREIERGVLDFGFAISQQNLDDFAQIKFDYRDRWGILMPKNHPLSYLKQINPKDLRDERIIISRQNGLIRNWGKWLGEDKDHVRQVGTYDMAETMNLLVKNGVGLAITFDKPEYRQQANSELLFKPLANFPAHNSKMIWKKERPLSKLDKIFLQLMREEAIQNRKI